MNHYHWNVSGRQPVAVHERPLTTDGVASFRTHRPCAGAHASECACHEFAIRARTKGHVAVSQCTLFSLARAESCPLSSVGPRIRFITDVSLCTTYAAYVRRSCEGCHRLTPECFPKGVLLLSNCSMIPVPDEV